MSLLQLPHARPHTLLFDWHATLADTMDAMYHAVDDVIPRLMDSPLMDRLVKTEDCKTVEDAKLVKYVREQGRLHPKLKTDRKVSRTDIFEVLFGEDQDAKASAHQLFDEAYRDHCGEVVPFEPKLREILGEYRSLCLTLGVLSNRKREYMEHELATIEDGSWTGLFDTMVCGDDVSTRKPAPDQILKALENLDTPPSTNCWYVGDSTTDVIAAKLAGVTAVFYNGAGWDHAWIDKIFPGTARHPHKPDAVVDSFVELTALVFPFWAVPVPDSAD